jgi:hypothetical protein
MAILKNLTRIMPSVSENTSSRPDLVLWSDRMSISDFFVRL